MKSRAVLLVILLAFLFALPEGAKGAEGGDRPLIGKIDVIVDGDRMIQVEIKVEEAFSDAVLKRIESGLKTTFETRLEVRRRRVLWKDAAVKKMKITHSVRFDNLSGEYHLSREILGEIREEIATQNSEEMQAWMSSLSAEHVLSLDELDAAGEYYVRVKTRLLSRSVLLIIPWDLETRWNRLWLITDPESPHGIRTLEERP